MSLFAAWCGYIGAWVLVAGPMYQGAAELSDIKMDFPAVRAQAQTMPPPDRISPWWWLLPPLAYVLTNRRVNAWQRQVLAALTPQQREGFVTFSNKATGWFVIGTGAALIGIKEAVELVEALRWPNSSALGLILLAAAVALTFTVGRLHLAQRVKHLRESAQ